MTKYYAMRDRHYQFKTVFALNIYPMLYTNNLNTSLVKSGYRNLMYCSKTYILQLSS